MDEHKICEWVRQDNCEYVTGCGNRRDEFLGGSTVEENGYFFCPYCGKWILETYA